MVKFIIVDDMKEEITHIKKLLDEVVKIDKEVLAFTNINAELKSEIENVDCRKIYILDIELGRNASGINIAKLIRDVDWESEIIFITNHDQMFESAHRAVYDVFDFIEKFQDFDKRFKKDIKEILKRNFDNKMFVYKGTNGIELSLYYKSILYIYRETEDRKLVVVTNSNRYMLSMSIKDAFEYLDDRFVQCHRSCIVNKTHITEKNYKEGYSTLDNGEKVYFLSKKYKRDLEND